MLRSVCFCGLATLVEQGYTALMFATEHQPAAVQPLVDAKSDVNATYTNVSILTSCTCVQM